MEIRGVIQVAGVIDRAEAEMLIEAGIRFLGFPLRLPVHREDLTEKEAAEIIRDFPPNVNGVLITYLDRAGEIIEFCEDLGVRIVQLHGDVSSGELRRLKEARPDLVVFKSLVFGLHSSEELRAVIADSQEWVDAYITDTYDPSTGASGATGKTHDWASSRELVEFSPKPVILAGGLNPENVREAIETVRPAGVDAHTGLESPDGRKAPAKVAKFVAEAERGFRETGG